MGDTLKRYLSAKQVVEKLNGSISVKLVYKLIAQGKLRVNRETGKVLVEEDSLIELLQGRAEKPPVDRVTPGRRGKLDVPLW
jgi:hypothetical protein